MTPATLSICDIDEAVRREAAEAQTNTQNAAQPQRFDYDAVVEMAKQRAAKPYSPPPKIPQFLQDFDYAKLDQIGYKRDRALWHDSGLPFEAMFYHPGSYYVHPVKMHLVTDDGVGEFRFDKNRFEYPNEDLRKRIPDDLSLVGFDGISTGLLVDPHLATVETDPRTMGQGAVHSVLARLLDRPTPDLPSAAATFSFRAGGSLGPPVPGKADGREAATSLPSNE